MADPEPVVVPIPEESPFARDQYGFLVRYDEPTEHELKSPVTNLFIDGKPVEEWLPGETVMKAVPTTDELGHPIFRHGIWVPRATTVYDVLVRIAARHPERTATPVLCHQPHLTPVAVCRLCSVVVDQHPPRPERPPGKLAPACQYRVADNMAVHTVNSRERIDWIKKGNARTAGEVVKGLVRTLAELLVTDHLRAHHEGGPSCSNELASVANELGVPTKRRFPLPLAGSKARTTDEGVRSAEDRSSPFIRVDHGACILCDRCSRGCTDVRKNDVIGRTGKGSGTRIAFDLDLDMMNSSCKTCGECAVWCPTDTLKIDQVNRPPLDPHIGGRTENAAGANPGGRRLGRLTADELREHPLFERLPPKLLAWHEGAVVRRALEVRPAGDGRWVGDVLFRRGQYGSSVFVLESGTLRLGAEPPSAPAPVSRRWWQFWRANRSPAPAPAPSADPVTVRTDAGSFLTDGNVTQWVTFDPSARFQMVGEDACLNNRPHAQTAEAAEPTVVLEISKPVLLALLRHPGTRDEINETLRRTNLEGALRQLINPLPLARREKAGLIGQLGSDPEFLRVAPGEVIYERGSSVTHCAFVRAGYLRLTRLHAGRERHDYVGPGHVVGPDVLAASAAADPVHPETVAAQDTVELIQFPVPPELRAAFRSAGAAPEPAPNRAADRAPNLSLMAHKLLVLDLDKCTRCDECTKACADTHPDGETRLLREGLREGPFLVATSCRSCYDTRCMVGCPVDAIHRRGGRLEIVIESHCIGCELCARNCPYGNIRMVPQPGGGAYPQKAITCDLCRNEVGPNDEPSCVYACPHDAAHRVDGDTLNRWVVQRAANGGTS